VAMSMLMGAHLPLRRVGIWRVQQFERGLPPAGKRENFVPRVAVLSRSWLELKVA